MVDKEASSGLDQRSDRIIIDQTGTMTPAVAAIALVAEYKGLEIAYANLDGPLVPTIRHQQVLCSGFWPIVRFLDRIRPYPCIHPLDPEDQTMHDAQCELALVDSRTLDAFWARYADPETETRYLGLRNRAPDLLDFTVAAYAYSPLVTQHSWLSQLLNEVEGYEVSA